MLNVHQALRKARVVVDAGRHLIRWHEPEAKIVRDAQAYWESPPGDNAALFAHWREGFDDPNDWLGLGRSHFELFERFSRSAHLDRPVRKVVEWGCGGGANAVHFGREAEALYGVDITRPSLDECAKQMEAQGLDCFHPVLVDAATPEAALEQVPHDCDLFTCFYVFELLPTPEYGVRVLEIAHRMLRTGGMALIQIKYATGFTTQARRWGYRLGMAHMTTYTVHDFWRHATDTGFQVHAITLQPRSEHVNDGPYAYFTLIKRP